MDHPKLNESSPFTNLEAAVLAVTDLHVRLIALCDHLTGTGPEYPYSPTVAPPGLLPLVAMGAAQIHERCVHMQNMLGTIETAMGVPGVNEVAPMARKQWSPSSTQTEPIRVTRIGDPYER